MTAFKNIEHLRNLLLVGITANTDDLKNEHCKGMNRSVHQMMINESTRVDWDACALAATAMITDAMRLLGLDMVEMAVLLKGSISLGKDMSKRNLNTWALKDGAKTVYTFTFSGRSGDKDLTANRFIALIGRVMVTTCSYSNFILDSSKCPIKDVWAGLREGGAPETLPLKDNIRPEILQMVGITTESINGAMYTPCYCTAITGCTVYYGNMVAHATMKLDGKDKMIGASKQSNMDHELLQNWVSYLLDRYGKKKVQQVAFLGDGSKITQANIDEFKKCFLSHPEKMTHLCELAKKLSASN